MYNRIGWGGRAIWRIALITIWGYVTWHVAGSVIAFALNQSEGVHQWVRTVGLAPIFTDFFKMLCALTGFFLIPLATTTIAIRIHKLVKGKQHETPERRSSDDGGQRIQRSYGALRRLPQQRDVRQLPGR